MTRSLAEALRLAETGAADEDVLIVAGGLAELVRNVAELAGTVGELRDRLPGS